MATDTAARSGSTLHSLFAQKAWINEELFAALAGIDATAHRTQVHSATRVLNHVYVVDCIFKGHLSGVPHGHEATNTKETPTLQSLAASVKEVDAWYVSYVSGLAPGVLHEPLRFSFTDGDSGLMSREEILMHVITHGAYHRGAAGQIMRAASVAPPRDLYTRFLHATQPERRQ
jgi:uncharacterized damage-inducible protein DinB